MQHPYGIQPWGNYWLKQGGPNIRDSGLGDLHVLSDALISEVLGYLGAQDLAKLSVSSKSFYCFCNSEDLWKSLVLEEYEGGFKWAGCWQQTYVASAGLLPIQPTNGATAPLEQSSNGHSCQQQDDDEAPGASGSKSKRKGAQSRSKGKSGKQLAGRSSGSCGAAAHNLLKYASRKYLMVEGFYSDLLYQPWFCATMEISPEWLETDNIDRRSNMSLEEFRQQYEIPNRPVVITDAVTKWPAMKKWSQEHLREAFRDCKIIAGNYEMEFETYLEYSRTTQDEMPLYLFDKTFCKNAPHLAQDFKVPKFFDEDLFSVLGDSRPDYRWLIVGPARSGSSFHVDPNCTSAWNGVVTGSKKWILYPPQVVPPGVHPSPDGADVATPVSLLEWFANFYEATKEGKVRPVECVVRAGEMIFVPRGWWHLAINLEESIAVTQNYVSSVNLPHVLDFLRPGRADLVSGCALQDRGNLHERFVEALQQQRPEVLEALEEQRQAKRRKVEEQRKLSALFKPSQDATAAGASSQPAGTTSFTFGFGASSASASNGGSKAEGASFSFGFNL